MIPIAMLALMMSLSAVLFAHIVTLEDQIIDQRAALDSYYVRTVSGALRLRLGRTGGLGTLTIANLESTDEGFAVRGVDEGRVALVGASNISDGVWQFDRALMYAIDDRFNFQWDPLAVSSNDCSTTAGFSSAPSWCSTRGGVVYDLIETRETYLQLLTDEALRMQGTLQKLARGYGMAVAATFPRGSAAIGGAAQICTAGGGACVAATCAGPVMLNFTPMDCGDQFSRWGAPVVINLPSAHHVALVTTALTVRRSDGSTRRIARELRVK